MTSAINLVDFWLETRKDCNSHQGEALFKSLLQESQASFNLTENRMKQNFRRNLVCKPDALLKKQLKIYINCLNSFDTFDGTEKETVL